MTNHASPQLSLERSLCALPSTVTDPSTPYGTPRITLLRHFPEIFHALHSFGAPSEPSTMINLGLSHPHLMDGILAVSASHLRLHSSSPKPHRVAEHFQQNLAVKRLKVALEEPLDQKSSDAILLSSMMLNLLAFSIIEPEADIRNSWVFSKDKERLGWFSLSLGYKPLLIATRQYHGEGTILDWMFHASDDQSRSFNGPPQPLHKVPAHWLWLCNLNAEDATEDNMFHEPLRILAMIKDLDPVPENYFLYLAFIGKVDFDFRDLVEVEDERAMWTLGFWLGLMSRFGFWWMRPRTTLDHRATKVWFEQKGVRYMEGWQGVMWQALMEDLEIAPYPPGAQKAADQVIEM